MKKKSGILGEKSQWGHCVLRPCHSKTYFSITEPLGRGKSESSGKPVPHAHAPEGAEFHQSRSRFVQCRNQSCQTEYTEPTHNGNQQPPVSYLRNSEIPQLLEENKHFQKTEDSIEHGIDQLSVAESPKRTERSENKQRTDRTVVRKKPVKRYNVRPVKEPPKIEDPNCPPGHEALEEDERLQMLERLKQSYEASLLELNRLPLCVDTLRVRTRRIDLEKHLQQTEKSIKLFSKPKVYVALSSEQ